MHTGPRSPNASRSDRAPYMQPPPLYPLLSSHLCSLLLPPLSVCVSVWVPCCTLPPVVGALWRRRSSDGLPFLFLATYSACPSPPLLRCSRTPPNPSPPPPVSF